MSPTQEFNRLYIGGEWCTPHSGRVILSIDPSTEEVWAEAAEADERDIDMAVDAAHDAMTGRWTRTVTASQRGGLLFKLAELIRRDAQKLAELESRDNGKPLRDTLGEVHRYGKFLLFSLASGRVLVVNPMLTGSFTYVVTSHRDRDPVGRVPGCVRRRAG